jgi:ribosomal protein S18 acetylase RimI-like enzyme
VRDAVLNPSSCQVLITAHAAEELTGFVTVHSTHQHIGKLHWLTVTPQWQRKGIGKTLTLTACRIATSELGYATMALKTETYRSAAISLYQNLGFHQVSTP